MSENRSVEVTGANIEEAIEKGLRELQVSRESVIVEILEEPNRGVLGLGTKEALVRLTTAARPRTEIPPSPADTSDPYYDAPEDDGLLELSDEELSDDLRVGREKLQTLLDYIGFDGDVIVQRSPHSDEDDETHILQIRGEDLRQLIGKRGETLASLQYITRLIASRDLQRRANFVVDAGEYKLGRSSKLHMLAHRIADQAVQRGKTMHMEPMPAHERRIIHIALRRREDVTTHSVGEGRYRKVTIVPEK